MSVIETPNWASRHVRLINPSVLQKHERVPLFGVFFGGGCHGVGFTTFKAKLS